MSRNRYRTVIVKAESKALSPNHSFVVTNRPGAWIHSNAVYNGYAMLGDLENLNKEIKHVLGWTTGDTRFKVTFFRLLISTAAHYLLKLMKKTIRLPDQEREPKKIQVVAFAGKECAKLQSGRRKLDQMGSAARQTWQNK